MLCRDSPILDIALVRAVEVALEVNLLVVLVVVVAAEVAEEFLRGSSEKAVLVGGAKLGFA